MLTQPQIQAQHVSPSFWWVSVYLTQGGCCIGGYHSNNNAQTYVMFDDEVTPCVLLQDVSALLQRSW